MYACIRLRMSMKRIAFYIEEKLLALLKERQQRTGVPVSEQIRRAIAAYIKGDKRK